MATEKLSTINGVDVFINDTHIVFFDLNIESPAISPQIEIPSSEWKQIVDFVNSKLNKDGK